MQRSDSSPSPSEFGQPVGQTVVGRRRFIVGAAGALGAGAVVAACGSDEAADSGSTDGTAAAGATDTATEGTAAAGGGDCTSTFGSNYSDEKPKAGMAAAIAATGVTAEINTVDHNSYQENFNTYVQQPDDVLSWFAGYRMRAFAKKGVVGDISDVWAGFTDMSEGFKNASTASDGKQYFVPFYFYAWGIHYRKSLFEEKGYAIPATWDELLALAGQMQTDGITPFCAANDGGWPQMGMFDMLNMRINGYDFHVSLMGGNEDWTGPEVKEVFTAWEELLPFYEPDANGREWQAAANSLGDKSAGMYLLGNFVTSNFDAATQQDIIDDIDFFAFPEINPEHGQDAIEAPIDGFMMAAAPENEECAKALLSGLGQKAAIEAYISVDPSVVAAVGTADTSGYNALQQKAADLVGAAKYISQFLDRDTDPAFASDVVAKALADFITDPSSIDTLLATVEEQKATYTFE
jgi:multiple sugar transport system substrate-binding protein